MCLGIFVMAIVPVVQAQDWGWPEQVKLTASDGTTNDYFGNSVSIIGNYAIVGAYGGGGNGGNRSGSAYVFKKSEIPGDPNWYQQCKLLASDGANDDYFGRSVSVSGDYAIIAAEGDDDKGDYSGSVYIFKKSDMPGDPNWYELSKLSASNLEAVDSFGKMVSINANTGTVLMI